MIWEPHDYQRGAVQHLDSRADKGSALLLDPGAGKTACVLEWIVKNKLGPVLIVAPLRVIQSVWRQEAEKWDQFKHLRFSLVHGTKAKRGRALKAKADVYLVNPEFVSKLENMKSLPQFEVLIVDESSKFKNPAAKRTRSLCRLAKRFKYRVILTGTPTPRSLEDLFSQAYVADLGETFGSRVGQFRNKYFIKGGFRGYQWLLRPGSQARIEEAVAPLAYRIDAKEFLNLPPVVFNDIEVDMPAKAAKVYKALERDLLNELDEEDLVLATSAGARYTKCRQVANGSVYDEEGEVQLIHTAKAEAIESLVEELSGKPLLVAYQFRHDLMALKKLFPNIPHIGGDVKAADGGRLIDEWNAGVLPILAVQPQSLSHGVNMQAGGNDLAWFGLPNDLELYIQLNARLHRQGVQGTVRIHRISTRGTVDSMVRERLESKDGVQQSLLASLLRYKNERK